MVILQKSIHIGGDNLQYVVIERNPLIVFYCFLIGGKKASKAS